MAALCSGLSQYHTDKDRTGKDGRFIQGKPYLSTTLADINKMLVDPPQFPKDQAQWAIFSSLMSRTHSEQLIQGEFHALWADIDEPQGLSLDEVFSRSSGFIAGAFIAYTSRSATPEKQKGRIIIALPEPVSGEMFIQLQSILNDKLEAAGITPDRATQRVGQICYLPNKGEFYHYCVSEGEPFNAGQWAEDLAHLEVKSDAEQRQRDEAHQQARLKAAQRMANGCASPIDAFNEAYSIELMFNSCGYLRKADRWLSPNSSSGSAGVSLSRDGQTWLSSHGSDAEIGRRTKNGSGSSGDAFDLFAFYLHGNNRNKALQAAGEMFTTQEGVSITRASQRAYMADEARIETKDNSPKSLKLNNDRNTFDPFDIKDLSTREAFDNPSEALRFESGILTVTDSKESTSRIIESQAVSLIAETIRRLIAWDAEANAWLAWAGSHWQPQSQANRVDEVIAKLVERGTHPVGYRVHYMNGIIEIMKRRALLPAPPTPVNAVPFANGLLNLGDMKLSPATPAHAFQWSLPHAYHINADCPTIKGWLLR